MGGDWHDACAGVVAAPILKGRYERIVPVALAGHLGAEVATEHAKRAARYVAGNPCGEVIQIGDEAAGGFVGREAEDDVTGALLSEQTG
jgi:hypothetical protein